MNPLQFGSKQDALIDIPDLVVGMPTASNPASQDIRCARTLAQGFRASEGLVIAPLA
jgi:hypothetical protein